MLDYVLLPFMVILAYSLSIRVRNKYYPRGHALRKYFIPALSVKIVGSIFLGLIYGYYYGYSDSFGFFEHSKVIDSSLDESVVKWINLIFHIPAPDDYNYYKYTSNMYWYTIDDASYIVAVLTAVLGLLNFNTYLPTSVLFALISFSGMWALFRTFTSLYPTLVKPIAVCILFIPGVVMWGSGILKDTVCMFALGWFTHTTFQLLIQKKYETKNFVLLVICFFLLAKVKVYILMAFLPAVGLWILFTYVGIVKNKTMKLTIKVLACVAIVTASLFFMQKFENELGAYSLKKITSFAENTKDWISYSTERDEGSGYDLGSISYTPLGMLEKFPQAVNVTLFRPYLWEARKPIVLISAIESLLFLFITLKLIFMVGFKKIWRTISTDNTVQFCLIFSIIFAFAIGITTFNFGTLSRYKIPCIPFFALALVLIYYKNVPKGKKLLPFL